MGPSGSPQGHAEALNHAIGAKQPNFTPRRGKTTRSSVDRTALVDSKTAALVAPPRVTWGALIGNPFLMISTLLWIATTVWAVWTLGADPSRDQETLASGLLGGNIGLSIGILQSHLGLRPTAV